MLTVYVSRKFWPWPKKYKCKGISWGVREERTLLDDAGHPLLDDRGQARFEIMMVNPDVLFLILIDERKVYVPIQGRIITYGRDVFEMELHKMELAAGQKIPMQ